MTSPFMEYVKETMWTLRYAKRTIESYSYWIKAFIIFNHKVPPSNCHDAEVEQFLSYISNQLNVAPKTQAQALNALSFLYKHIMNKALGCPLSDLM